MILIRSVPNVTGLGDDTPLRRLDLVAEGLLCFQQTRALGLKLGEQDLGRVVRDILPALDDAVDLAQVFGDAQ